PRSALPLPCPDIALALPRGPGAVGVEFHEARGTGPIVNGRLPGQDPGPFARRGLVDPLEVVAVPIAHDTAQRGGAKQDGGRGVGSTRLAVGLLATEHLLDATGPRRLAEIARDRVGAGECTGTADVATR